VGKVFPCGRVDVSADPVCGDAKPREEEEGLDFRDGMKVGREAPGVRQGYLP
jgi:hypothetical protein